MTVEKRVAASNNPHLNHQQQKNSFQWDVQSKVIAALQFIRIEVQKPKPELQYLPGTITKPLNQTWFLNRLQ